MTALGPEARELADARAELARLSAELEVLRHQDPATGLPDRIRLADRASQALLLAQRQGACVAVLHLELDGFRGLRKGLTFESADALLTDSAERLGAVLGPADTLARLGEEAFGVLLPDLRDPAEALRIAQALLEALAAPFSVGGRPVHLGASIGLSCHPMDASDADTLLHQAEGAAARAREEGGNRIQCTTPTLSEASLERRELELYLGEAIVQGDLEVFYQPQFHADGSLLGAEALVRWHHPVLGAVPPAKFIPLAEESRLIHPLGEWVMETACRQVARWRARSGLSLRLAVNVSAHQVAQSGWAEGVAAILEATGLPPGALELELTESALLRHGPHGASPLRQLRTLGVRLGIDDFGTGYSSLSYLQRLPVDTLKIDQSFVAGLEPPDPDLSSRPIVLAIVALGRSLSLDLVAEGIETEGQRRALVDLGCDVVQGYLLGRPMRAAEFEGLVVPGRGT